MSRLAIRFACLVLVAGFSGCASCGCNQCGYGGGGYAMNDGYPIDAGFNAGQGDCGCSGGGQSVGAYGSNTGYGEMSQMYGDVGQPLPAGSQPYVTTPTMTSSVPQYTNFNTAPASPQPMQTQASRTMPQNQYSGNIQQAGFSTWDVSPAAAPAMATQSYPRRAPCNCGR